MITPTERARLVIRHAYLAGGGEPITRADVLADLDRNQAPVTSTPASLTASDPEPAPSDPIPVTPDPTPDPDPGNTSSGP
ncbi:hypothetical protein AB1484_31955 [Parafrankia sp. FMc6]|uniref:hypothetical protein n=1 Tax=Parafrankia soli TaxID=2599596 RepID=UPI0034D7A43A